MERRRSVEVIAANVAAIANPTTIASAADIDRSAVHACLNVEQACTITDLIRVGGFFRVPTAELLKGLPA